MTITAVRQRPGTRPTKQSLEHAAAEWATQPRWAGVARSYTAADVVPLRGSIVEEQTWPGRCQPAVASADGAGLFARWEL